MLKINIEHNMAKTRSVLLEFKSVTTKITDVLNRLMHTFELLENNQIHYHNLTINDVTISAQINQLQAGAVNILQKINERFA